MTDAELDRINAERRRRGLPPLTRSQATNAVISSPKRNDDGFNSSDFLIDCMVHLSPSASGPSPSYSPPDPSPSHDSCSSYDSGGSSGGGDGGGGGGGE